MLRTVDITLDRYRGGYAAVEAALAEITDEELDRPGPYSVDDWLGIYATHSHDHAAQIRAAREGSLA